MSRPANSGAGLLLSAAAAYLALPVPRHEVAVRTSAYRQPSQSHLRNGQASRLQGPGGVYPPRVPAGDSTGALVKPPHRRLARSTGGSSTAVMAPTTAEASVQPIVGLSDEPMGHPTNGWFSANASDTVGQLSLEHGAGQVGRSGQPWLRHLPDVKVGQGQLEFLGVGDRRPDVLGEARAQPLGSLAGSLPRVAAGKHRRADSASVGAVDHQAGAAEAVQLLQGWEQRSH